MAKGRKTGGSVKRLTDEQLLINRKISQQKSNAKHRETLRELRIAAGRNPESVNGN